LDVKKELRTPVFLDEVPFFARFGAVFHTSRRLRATTSHSELAKKASSISGSPTEGTKARWRGGRYA